MNHKFRYSLRLCVLIFATPFLIIFLHSTLPLSNIIQTEKIFNITSPRNLISEYGF